MRAAKKMGSSVAGIKGPGRVAVGIFQDIRQMSPVLAEYRALKREGAFLALQLITDSLPEKEIFIFQPFRLLDIS